MSNKINLERSHYFNLLRLRRKDNGYNPWFKIKFKYNVNSHGYTGTDNNFDLQFESYVKICHDKGCRRPLYLGCAKGILMFHWSSLPSVSDRFRNKLKFKLIYF